jgi:iron-sulfur cluster assembly protein
MFGMPVPIKITPTAVRQILKLTPEPGSALRIGLKKGGCAGMEYTMDIVPAAERHDIEIEQDGARVLLAPTAQMFLIGTEIDYESSLLESGFKFRNPNVEDACGCGESVSFKVDRDS